MTTVVEFFVGVLGRVCSGLLATYLVRLIDKFFQRKNNRPDQG